MKLIRMICLMLFLTMAGSLPAVAQDAPYVGAYEADTFFPTITSNEMEVLRTKKILFASRSFGLNMRDGLERLKNSNPMHDILDDYVRYDVFSAGGDLSIIPTNVYENFDFVHFLATYWPHTQRIEELDTLIRDEPHTFHDDIDVAMIYFHYAQNSIFGTYSNMMDSLQADFPHIKFIYVTAGFMDTNHVAENTESAAFSAQVRTAYQGNVPLYDLGYILNNDDACGLGYCPEYSSDPAGVHPNADFAERRMGKAFLLILRDAFLGSSCTSAVPPSVPANLAGSSPSDTSIGLTWDESTHPECGVSRYELTRDGSFIGSTHFTNYTDTGLAEDTSYDYAVRAVSMADVVSAYSSTVTVSTLADSVAPTLVEADAFSSTQVSVEFSEALDQASSETASNYTLNNGVSVLSASLSVDTVTLSTSEMTDGVLYTLTVNNVADASSATNPIAPGSQVMFTYQDSPYPDDPDGYWAFDGDLNDSTSNANHASWVNGEAFGPGLLNEGLALDGTSIGSYPKTAHDSVLDGMDNLAISVWARRDNASVGGDLFRKHAVYKMETTATGLSIYFYNASGAAVYITATAPINDTDWHHYCLNYDGTNLVAYVDGVAEGSTPQSGAVQTFDWGGIYMGKDPWGNTFGGDIDEMKLFRRALSTNEIAALVSAGPAGAADRAAVRALLDANGLTSKQVDAVSVYEDDRIIRLHLQEGGVSNITSDIGQLSELSLLHCYGDRALGYPLLTTVAPEIGNCVKLEELLLSQNDLTDLPGAITNLTALSICSIGDNQLCDADPAWESWADTYDPDWRDTQYCPVHIRSILTGPGTVWPTNDLEVPAGQSTQVVYSADAWYEVSEFLQDGVSVPAAIGQSVHTSVHANVASDTTNEVTFSVILAPVDGTTPATWYGPLGADPTLVDEDMDFLALSEEYLINSNPTQSNAFKVASFGLDGGLYAKLNWESLGLPHGQVRMGFQQDLNGGSSPLAGATTYTNGVCTWRSTAPASDDPGFMQLSVTNAL